jgi:DNA-binding LacI/PurR family transcriptional regulator
MTLMKLAELAGVSVATVSKAFSGSKEIGNTTREHIFALAKEHGCFEKYYKSPRKRPLIALIFPEPESEYYNRMIGIFERTLHEHGMDSVVAFSRFDEEREAELFREFSYRMQADGVIVGSSGRAIRNPDEIPLITFSKNRRKDSNSDTVNIDFEGAVTRLVETLKEYGHTKVGFLGETLTKEKEDLVRNALRRAGLSVRNSHFFTSKKRFMEAGEDGMRALIERGDLPSVIIASYDQIAYGAMKHAIQCGYRIPKDISFVGFDNISSASYLGIPLSSLHVDLEDTCQKIVSLLEKRIHNRHYREREPISVPVNLIERESIGRIQEET